MQITSEHQPYINKDLNQPRTCIWITPETVEEVRFLDKLMHKISDVKNMQCGFTGVHKEVLLIAIPDENN
jgi:hypothetical protein